MNEEQKPVSLRERVLQGGLYLVLRQGMGMLISLGGMFLLTRLIGPAHYGLYVSALGLLGYLTGVTGLGLNVYLVRQEQEQDRTAYDQAFTLLLGSTVLVVILGILAAPWLSSWEQKGEFGAPFVTLLLTLPLTSLTVPSLARLEKALNYRAVAMLELVGQISYYALALPLAYKGLGVWAPVWGYWLQQAVMMTGTVALAKYLPRFVWNNKRVREMVSYGIGYSASIWVWQLRSLVNPLLVGRFAGPDAVGYIALGIRLVEALSFVKAATWRISIAALAKIQDDRTKLSRVLNEAMGMQVLSMGPFLGGFAAVAPWFVPFFFGAKWAPLLQVYPFIALSYLVNAVFSMHSSVLYVLRRNWDVTWFHVVHVVLFAGSAAVLVPRLGFVGYGYGEAVALLGYLFIHNRLAKQVRPSYRLAWPWLLAFVPVLFAPIFGYPRSFVLWLPLLLIVLVPRVRAQVMELVQMVLKKRRGFQA